MSIKIMETAINLYRLSSELQRIENYDEALKNFKVVIKLCAKYPQFRKIRGGAYYHIACIYKKYENLLQTINHLKKCLAVYPEHKMAFKFLNELIHK